MVSLVAASFNGNVLPLAAPLPLAPEAKRSVSAGSLADEVNDEEGDVVGGNDDVSSDGAETTRPAPVADSSMRASWRKWRIDSVLDRSEACEGGDSADSVLDKSDGAGDSRSPDPKLESGVASSTPLTDDALRSGKSTPTTPTTPDVEDDLKDTLEWW